MSQRQWIVIIGAWVMVFLFVGLPSSLEKILAVLTGLLIIVFAYRLQLKENARPADTFSDSAASAPSDYQPDSSSPADAA